MPVQPRIGLLGDTRRDTQSRTLLIRAAQHIRENYTVAADVALDEVSAMFSRFGDGAVLANG